MSKTDEPFCILLRGVITVGEGRGFVVEHSRRRERLVLTAAHCLPLDDNGCLKLPPPNPARYLHEQTYPILLGPLRGKPTVWVTCLFVDPIADIAALGCPDDQELSREANAYEEMMESTVPLAIAPVVPKMDSKGDARVLSLADEWMHCRVTASPAWSAQSQHIVLSIDQEKFVDGGMSGSPILSPDGRAIGLVSTPEQHPILRESLPMWFFH